MSRLSAFAVFSAAIMALLTTQPSHAQGRPDPTNTLIFSVEFENQTGRRNAPPKVEVIFYGTQPPPQQAEAVLRNCLNAAAVLRPATDLVATAWLSLSQNEVNRQPAILPSGNNSLRYRADDAPTPAGEVTEAGVEAPAVAQTTPAAAPPAPTPAAQPVETVVAETAAPSETAAADETPGATETAAATVVAPAEEQAAEEAPPITEDPTVVEECKNVPPDRVAALVDVGAQTTSAERKHIVKAMRTWCKDNEIAMDRDLRDCLSAVSKAIVAVRGPTTLSPDEIAEAVTRGAEVYRRGQCGRCHQNNGRGGARGPNLTDGEWLHGPRSLESIRRILVSGVPQSELKDANRPAPMEPVTNLITDDAQITDLAAYVLSLSQE